MTCKKHSLLFCVIGILILSGCSNGPSPGKQVFITEGVSSSMVEGFWLYLPKTYDENKKWPVILFLQGSDGASPNPRTSKDAGPVKYALRNSKQLSQTPFLADSFIIINPHMNTGPIEKRQWYQYSKTLVQIVDDVTKKYAGDQRRIYITGLSRGGHGSWGVVKNYPNKFAAVVPIAGEISCMNDCEKISDVPMWIIHNHKDRNVDYDYSLGVVEFMENKLDKPFQRISTTSLNQNQLKSKFIFSSLEQEGHDAWSAAYSSPSLYLWLLDKKLLEDENSDL